MQYFSLGVDVEESFFSELDFLPLEEGGGSDGNETEESVLLLEWHIEVVLTNEHD